MNIVIFEIEDWEREHFQTLAAGHELVFVREPLAAENAADYSGAEVISSFIYSKLDRETLEKLPALGLIATRSTGIDHIDLDFCEEKGVLVANVPSYGANTVAEHAFALLLTLSHRMEEAIDRTRKGDFSSRGLRGFDLLGKTLGVIGTGDIGRWVIRIAKGFGMFVLACDVKPDEQVAREVGFEYADMDRVLRESDVITLHVPGNEDTRGLIGRDEFETMKDGAVLINTARGSVVDTPALLRALADGKLSAAGLDVLPEESVLREEAELLRSVYDQQHDLGQLLSDQLLTRMRNVVVTPHSAFNTREAVDRILETTVANIRRFAAGRPDNIVQRRPGGGHREGGAASPGRGG